MVYNVILRNTPEDLFSVVVKYRKFLLTTIHVLQSTVVKIACNIKIPDGLILYWGLDVQFPEKFHNLDHKARLQGIFWMGLHEYNSKLWDCYHVQWCVWGQAASHCASKQNKFCKQSSMHWDVLAGHTGAGISLGPFQVCLTCNLKVSRWLKPLSTMSSTTFMSVWAPTVWHQQWKIYWARKNSCTYIMCT